MVGWWIETWFQMNAFVFVSIFLVGCFVVCYLKPGFRWIVLVGSVSVCYLKLGFRWVWMYGVFWYCLGDNISVLNFVIWILWDISECRILSDDTMRTLMFVPMRIDIQKPTNITSNKRSIRFMGLNSVMHMVRVDTKQSLTVEFYIAWHDCDMTGWSWHESFFAVS